jgi:hypothetical protein
MQDDRTIAVNIDDLRALTFFAAQGILMEAEEPDLESMDNEVSLRAELGQMLAMAYGYANVVADAQNQDGTRVPRSELAQLLAGGGPDDLPYSEVEVLNALSGKMTARPVHAA